MNLVTDNRVLGTESVQGNWGGKLGRETYQAPLGTGIPVTWQTLNCPESVSMATAVRENVWNPPLPCVSVPQADCVLCTVYSV